MDKDWVGTIESASDAVDADRVQRIKTYLAEDIFPEWQKIDNMETYFAKERQEYLKATEVGPKEPWMPWRSMWDLGTGERRKAIRESYEEVCRFMRYFHGLAKRVERSRVEAGE